MDAEALEGRAGGEGVWALQGRGCGRPVKILLHQVGVHVAKLHLQELHQGQNGLGRMRRPISVPPHFLALGRKQGQELLCMGLKCLQALAPARPSAFLSWLLFAPATLASSTARHGATSWPLLFPPPEMFFL